MRRISLLVVMACLALAWMRLRDPDMGLFLPATSSLARCLLSFGLGCGVHWAFRALPRPRSNGALGFTSLLGFASVLALMSVAGEQSPILLAAPFLFSIVILALARDEGAPVLTYLGDRSYSIYLNHVGVLIVVSFFVSRLSDAKIPGVDHALSRVPLWLGDWPARRGLHFHLSLYRISRP